MDATVNIVMPKKWSELSDKQLRLVHTLVSQGRSNIEIQTICLLRWGNMRVHGSERVPGRDSTEFHISMPFKQTLEGPLQTVGRGKRARLHLLVDAEETMDLAHSLDWLQEMPDRPVRPSKVRGRRPLMPMLDGIDFETYLIIDNRLQGWIHTKDAGHLRELADILFPPTRLLRLWRRVMGLWRKDDDKPDWLGLAALQWATAVKWALSRLYPHILKRGDSKEQNGPQMAGGLPNAVKAIDAQLRALTRGDITKEEAIRGMPYRRALTELDALARENEEHEARMAKLRK